LKTTIPGVRLNRIVQPPGCFVELLAIAQPDQIIARAPQVFSFGALSREFLARAEGLSMLALESRNASEDAESFCAAGFGRHTGFFVCQQHQPQNFWDRALQVRPNGVSTIARAVLVAENPADHHIFLSMLAGERNLRAPPPAVPLRL
jgi:hypothetical protein